MAATQHFSVDPSVPVPITLGTDGGLAAEEPVTIGQIFKKTCSIYPDHTALASLQADEWVKVSFSQYYQFCIRAAKSFMKLGLEPLHGVAIIGFNSPEWSISIIGTIFADGLASGIYATSSPSACQYIAQDCKANVVVVENDAQLQKFLKVRDQLPHLKAIVQYKGALSGSYPNVYEWDDFLKLGDDLDDQLIEDKIAAQKPTTCASLIYTSGTTGDPKGVMLTHDNITWASKSVRDSCPGAFAAGECLVSYLPLSHIAGQLVDIYIPLCEGVAVHFAQPDALKGTLGVTLKQVQPHTFLGVPRVWEKFMEAIKAMLPPPGSGPPPSAEMMKAINAKVLGGLGLSRCKVFITAAAPIALEVLQFFARLGITISEVWGMSELSGPGTISTKLLPNYYKLGSLGKPFVGMEIKIDQPDPKTGEGEICSRGRNIMMGYLNKFDKTNETIDSEGWLHSGDLGRQDEDGFFYITGRIKEIIITSGGENIAPVPIEDRIKKHALFISNVVLVGEKRKFLTCLVTLKCQMNPATGVSLDDLSPESLRILGELGSTAKTASEIINNKDPVVYSAIQKAIDAANTEAASNAQKVQKFVILKDDLSVPGGELGPTLKLKRFYVLSKYSETIDQMYN